MLNKRYSLPAPISMLNKINFFLIKNAKIEKVRKIEKTGKAEEIVKVRKI